MVEKIIWSPRAINEYEKIISFLFLICNEKVIHDFENLVNQNVSAISKNPNLFPVIKAGIRKVSIHRNVSLFYEFKEQENIIEILSIFDNRENPDKLKL